MRTVKQGLPWQHRTPLGLEIRYERAFLIDLKKLEPIAFGKIKRFVFEEFSQLNQLHDLPAFHQIGSSKIFYRFTLEQHLISLEVTGQLVKFLRILPAMQP